MNPTADQQLQSAAYGGDYTACKAAYAQGATNFNKMLYEAARGGHRDLCELAVAWAKAHGNPLDTTVYNAMLYGAAYGGHRDLCELAVAWAKAHGNPWVADDFNGMLYWAAYGGHRDLCEMAKSWGATHVNWMLYKAARGGHRDLCELAKSWGADNFNDIFIEDMREDIQQLIKYWQACKGDPTLPAWVSLFGLLAITDDYFHLTQASFEHVRWVKILSQLPLELQAMICFQCHGLAQEPVVTAQKIDTGGRWLFPAGDTPAIS